MVGGPDLVGRVTGDGLGFLALLGGERRAPGLAGEADRVGGDDDAGGAADAAGRVGPGGGGPEMQTASAGRAADASAAAATAVMQAEFLGLYIE